MRGNVPEDMLLREASLYMTGKLLKDFLCPDLDFYGCEDDFFDWIWKLVCECHEKGFRIKADVLTCPDFSAGKSFVEFSDGSCAKKSPVTEEELKDYFYYRHICCRERKPDHGIAGGMLLLEKLQGDLGKCAEIYFYAATTLMCHNVFGQSMAAKKCSVQENPLLCLLLLSEALEPLHLCEENADWNNAQKFLRAVQVEKQGDSLIVTVDPEIIPFELYTEKLVTTAKKTGIRVSVGQKSNNIHIRV